MPLGRTGGGAVQVQAAPDWRDATPCFKAIHTRLFSGHDLESQSEELLEKPIGSDAARRGATRWLTSDCGASLSG